MTTTTPTTTTTTTTTTASRWEDCGDIWVCTDCYFAHHYGATEHDGLWYAGDSDTPCDREPLAGLGDDIHVFDNACSNHDTEDLYDDDGDSTGETTECQYCGETGDENGIHEFSWSRCQGCDSSLGGSRYRLSLKRRIAGADVTR